METNGTRKLNGSHSEIKLILLEEEKLEKATAEFLAQVILKQLSDGNRVLWLVPGGSGIPVVIEAAKIISKQPHNKLIVSLTDERYGTAGHADSNWEHLLAKGFSLPQAHLISVLGTDSMAETTEKFSTAIGRAIYEADYILGFFGIGTDGHTAGILPGSEAVNSPDMVCGYHTLKFDRITLTPQAIKKLHEVVVFARGEKRKVIKDLQEKTINTAEQPAQILKMVPKLTIFSEP